MSRITTENELLSVQIPNKTETYTPVPHKILIQEVQDKIKQRGLNIISKEYIQFIKQNNGWLARSEYAIW